MSDIREVPRETRASEVFRSGVLPHLGAADYAAPQGSKGHQGGREVHFPMTLRAIPRTIGGDMSPTDAARVTKLYADMYEGNGKDNPPMTTRMSRVEDICETLSRNISKGLWLLAGQFVALCTAILLAVIIYFTHLPRA